MSEYGDLTVTRHTEIRAFDGATTYTAKWDGPRFLIITHELMDEGMPPMRRDGDLVTICQYKMRIIARNERGDYVVERIDDGTAMDERTAV